MRADLYLVEHGFFDTRARAQAAIAAGRVRVDGEPVSKPSQKIPAGAVVEAEPAHPFVSRAALKLAAALDDFAIDPGGRVCLDVGASTGGFTEVLITRGAVLVYAVDVGRGQLHPSLRGRADIVNLEATDARALSRAEIGQAPSLVVCDASFISLEKLLPVPLSLASDHAELVTLFKPQFEVGRAHVGKGGIVKDADAVERAKEKARAFLARAGWPVEAERVSPVAGGDGNVEYLFLARRTQNA